MKKLETSVFGIVDALAVSRADSRTRAGARPLPELRRRASRALSYFPRPRAYRVGPDEYWTHLARERNHGLPIIGSLNRRVRAAAGGARAPDGTGRAPMHRADIYMIPPIPEMNGPEVDSCTSNGAGEEEVTFPLAVKIGPFFSAMPNMARG